MTELGDDVENSDSRFDRVMWAIRKRSSGRTIGVIALACYAGIGLLLPLLLGWPMNWLVGANIVGTTAAAMFILLWLAVRVQEGHRRHLVDWTTDLRLLDSSEFEWLVGEIFRRDGWTVEETGRRDGPDGAVDLVMRRDGKRWIVQCKRWTARAVGVDEIRTFAGALMREHLPGSQGMYVTLSQFGVQARAEAASIGLALVDNEALHAMMERVRRHEECPNCGTGMVLNRSSYGWWYRCRVSGCGGKRDLGADPVRAVDLLTTSAD